MATPALSALLCLGGVPSPRVLILGLITAFAGYTAVYALNDVVDYRVDQAKWGHESSPDPNGGPARDLDAVHVRHPLAQGVLPLWEGIAWVLVWSFIALAGAYLLNPLCAAIFLSGAVLETVYCLLLRVSCLRVLIAGVVKTLGGIAAAFAVDPAPPIPFLLVLSLWLFSWEIGGQNVPNDLMDVAEDRKIAAMTIPVHCGLLRAKTLAWFSLLAAAVLSLLMFGASPARLNLLYLLGAILGAAFLLLMPGYRLYADSGVESAGDLFHKASHYPVMMLVVVLVGLIRW